VIGGRFYTTKAIPSPNVTRHVDLSMPHTHSMWWNNRVACATAGRSPFKAGRFVPGNGRRHGDTAQIHSTRETIIGADHTGLAQQKSIGQNSLFCFSSYVVTSANLSHPRNAMIILNGTRLRGRKSPPARVPYFFQQLPETGCDKGSARRTSSTMIDAQRQVVVADQRQQAACGG